MFNLIATTYMFKSGFQVQSHLIESIVDKCFLYINSLRPSDAYMRQ